jgi:hypothetical protein
MTALVRLDRTRRLLLAATVASALLWGLALLVLLLFVTGLLDLATGIPLGARRIARIAASIAGVTALGMTLWRNRGVRSRGKVALWLEAQTGAMSYALVTLAEERFAALGPRLEPVIAGVSWGNPVRQALLRSIGLPLLITFVALIGLMLLPAGTVARVTGPRTGDVLVRPSTGLDPFDPLVVTIIPPTYSRLAPETKENPESITGLVGSRIRIQGRAWSDSLTMPDTASPLWLERENQRRLLLLLPVRDSVPLVRLVLPARDTVRGSPAGRVSLASEVRDDYGLARSWFEYIVSSGEGENFTFRSGVVGLRSLAGSATGEISTRLLLDSLALAPGNIVHLRAVARDENIVSGPGTGYSESRTIRIPRPGEGDTVAVDQAQSATGDSSLLSQRMLIILAEALVNRRPRLVRDTFVAESRRIARDQAALRRRVADIIFLRLGSEVGMEEHGEEDPGALTPEALLEAAEQATATSGGEALDFSEDETPVVALNRPLLEAYNAMWSAGRELEIGEPARALPHMRTAVEAIQRARQAERLYLRGRSAARAVDLARVRLAGRLADANPIAASGSPQDRRVREALLRRFTGALELLPQDAGVDSLQLLRLDALSGEPRVAAALGEAVGALRAGADATGALIAARRALAGPPRRVAGLGPWDAAP